MAAREETIVTPEKILQTEKQRWTENTVEREEPVEVGANMKQGGIHDASSHQAVITRQTQNRRPGLQL